jgi:hypothetical protein
MTILFFRYLFEGMSRPRASKKRAAAVIDASASRDAHKQKCNTIDALAAEDSASELVATRKSAPLPSSGPADSPRSRNVVHDIEQRKDDLAVRVRAKDEV